MRHTNSTLSPRRFEIPWIINTNSNVNTINKTARALPKGQFRACPKLLAITLATMLVLPPPSMSDCRNEPSAGMKTNATPEIIPGRIEGKTILRTTVIFFAPKS